MRQTSGCVAGKVVSMGRSRRRSTRGKVAPWRWLKSSKHVEGVDPPSCAVFVGDTAGDMT